MILNKILANRLREVYLDGKWIANTNFKEQLALVTYEIACKPIGQLNSIAKLTFHLNYYLKGLLEAFRIGKLNIADKYSFDMPEIGSEMEWRGLVNELLMNASLFSEMVGQMDNSQFELPFIDPKYGTVYRNIEGVIEHSYYHLGQIVLLVKLVKPCNYG